MISYRYHLVTIVAVFLALGLGLLAGTTVVDAGLVQRLKDQTSSANARADALQTKYDQLNGGLARSQQLAAEVVPPLEQGRLAGTDVVVVADKNIDPAVTDQSAQALKNSGARLVTTLSASPRLASSDPAARAQLAQILGADPQTPSGTLTRQAATALAGRLASGPAISTPGTKDSNDILLQLLDGGFLVASPSIQASDVTSIGGSGQPVVVLGGGDAEPAVPPGAFLVPLTDSLVKQKVPVVAAEGSHATTEFVTTLRSDGSADGKQMVTVDNLDEPVGGLALVLGLSDFLATNQGGNYGFKHGADQLYPPPSP